MWHELHSGHPRDRLRPPYPNHPPVGGRTKLLEEKVEAPRRKCHRAAETELERHDRTGSPEQPSSTAENPFLGEKQPAAVIQAQIQIPAGLKPSQL